MSNSIGSLLVLAVIAIFLILKLRNVLGTRDGFEGPPQASIEDRMRARDMRVVPGRDVADESADYLPADSEGAKALQSMRQLEPSFNVNEFLKGARSAYEMILMAFETGNLDRVKQFIAPDVFESFSAVVKDREMRGLSVDASFVGLKELALEDADFDDTSREAELTVRFVGELTRIVKDRSGAVVSGHATDIVRQRDVWTFARVFGSNDPNWQLVATSD